jgi:fructoselysine-6-P-deglycase FrlB-like protein
VTAADQGSTRYERDVLSQPAVLRDIAARFGGSRVIARWADEWRLSGQPEIVLTGMGASLYAAEVAAVMLARGGVRARATPTSQLVDLGLTGIADDALIFVISQSGESAELRPLLAQAPPARLRALTNRDESPLGLAVPERLVLGIDPDLSVAVRTYTGSVALLLMFAAEIISRSSRSLADAIVRTALGIEEGLSAWQPSAASLAPRIARARATSFVG